MSQIPKLSQANQVIIERRKSNLEVSSNNSSAAETSKLNELPNDVYDGKSKTSKKKILITGGVVLASLLAITALVLKNKGSKVNEVFQNANEIITKTRNEIDFKDGMPYLKNSNEKFNGIIKDSVKTGQKDGFKPFDYILEYKDGVLTKSTKKQADKIIEKTFETLEDGTRKITSSDSEKPFIYNLKELKSKIDESKVKLKNLIDNKEKLTADEFNQKTNEITYLSKKQKEENLAIFNVKKENELNARKAAQEAEKAAQEAEKAAQEAEIKNKEKKQTENIQTQQKQTNQFLNPDYTVKSRQEIEKMSQDELREYYRATNIELNNIRKRYSAYAIPSDYEKEDYELYLKLNSNLNETSNRMKKINEENLFNELMQKLSPNSNIYVKDKKSGQNIELKLNKQLPKNGGAYRINVSDNKNTYGLAEVSTPCGQFIANLPEKYADNALELKFLSTSEAAKGTGTQIIKQVVQDSQKLGYDGNVWVDACGGSLPSAMASLCKGKYTSSPVPFYFKAGFRFCDEEMNQQVQKGLENLAKGLEYDGPKAGNMFLPAESVAKILNS